MKSKFVSHQIGNAALNNFSDFPNRTFLETNDPCSTGLLSRLCFGTKLSIPTNILVDPNLNKDALSELADQFAFLSLSD